MGWWGIVLLLCWLFFLLEGQAVFYNQEFRNSSSRVWFELLIYFQPDPNTRPWHFMVFLFMWTVRIISQSSFPDFSTSQTHVFFLSFWAAGTLCAFIGKPYKVLVKRKCFDLDKNLQILVVWLFLLVRLVVTGARLGQLEVELVNHRLYFPFLITAFNV